ncbi:uncharacterized protein V1510DRAFT_392589 [Dipodascopsis tothii]|uniref:uncharacterized protein n=1 Tax=Dipodascopsis tothii TaxID=44089 RepID=UPI0034CE7C57
MEQDNKAHRPVKTKSKKKALHANGYNAKAFAVAAPGKLERQARRSHDVNEKRFHVPMVDRTPEEAPPVIVAVVGPPGTGKTTLIKSLIRRYTKHTLSDIRGPVTVVSGKRRRLTFLECSNDLNSMIDVAKIADLVLLMIDGNFGLEMETMEFLNILAPHGFPRILGVATHLDLFKSPATLRASKKRLKHRLWTEVYQGAKLFYLSGVMNGRYPDREVLNLARFISVMKFRPLKWRNEHSYLLADRVVDITHPAELEQNPKMDRTVTLYGYVHGTALSPHSARVHVPGIGDLTVADVERLPDPCPTPYQEKKDVDDGKVKRRKRLDEKQKVIYAPMSDVGGLLIDKDAVYVDVGTRSFAEGAEKGVGERLVVELQNAQKMLGEQSGGLQLFTDSAKLPADALDGAGDTGRKERRVVARAVEHDDDDFEDDGADDDDDADDADDLDREEAGLARRAARAAADDGDGEDYVFADSDSDLGDFSDDDELGAGATRWKAGLVDRAKERFYSTRRRWDLGKLLYLDNIEPEDVIRRWRDEELSRDDGEASDDEADGIAGDFFKKADAVPAATAADDIDRSLPVYDDEQLKARWADESAIKAIKARFLTGSFDDADGSGDDAGGDDDDGSDDGSEVFGDYEDLETGEKVEADGPEDGAAAAAEQTPADGVDYAKERDANAKKKEKLRLRFEEEEEGQEDDGLGEDDLEKKMYDTWHDAQKAKIAKQLDINKAEYDEMDQDTRDRIEGFRSGVYVRVVIPNIPCEFVEGFDPKYPVVMGSLLASEDRFGFVQVRIKRHRWHKKILKTNDPLIFSLGWRRFQSMPVYTTSDSRTRNRMLKYTPEHMHCTASFYGPLVAPNTGFCAVQSVANSAATGAFRIAATGTVTDVDQSVEIVKKLKLVGTPYKIFKNTAFVQGMFTSALEVAKFEGASIKTVSGIRGQIKRALAKPEGHFRATFEDKVLMSDIVILRAWYPIKARKFYNPVTSLLVEDKAEWKGMKLTGQVRHERSLAVPNEKDSQYKNIERPERRFNPLRVPKAIRADLPYKAQLTAMRPQKRATYLQKRAVVLGGDERKARDVMVKVMTLSNEQRRKRAEKKAERREVRDKKLAKDDEKRRDRERRDKQEHFRREGKKRGASGGAGGRGKRQRGEDDD